MLRGAMAAGVAASGGLAAAGAASAAPRHRAAAPVYVNPLIEQRADPHITRHTDGRYYFTGTVPEYDRIVLRRVGERIRSGAFDRAPLAAGMVARQRRLPDG